MTQSRKVERSTTHPDFPYSHVVNEETKTIEIGMNGHGQLARYGIPAAVKKYYPGYDAKIV